MPWPQTYDPLGSRVLSTLCAALPLVILLGLLATHKVRAPVAAVLATLTAAIVAAFVFGMPMRLVVASAAYGMAYGLFPIGWIVLNVIFLYRMTADGGHFDIVRAGIAGLTGDKRLQLLLIAFAFGAFFEGAAGFGTPVAVTAALLLGLGFTPLEASGLSLIANTAPVAFGALGTPVVALQGVTGLDMHALSAAVGRQLPVFSCIIPFWLVAAYAGWAGVRATWPALIVAGVSFAVPQWAMATFHGPWLVDVVAAAVCIACTVAFLKVWQPRDVDGTATAATPTTHTRAEALRAWFPWVLLSVLVFLTGIPAVKGALNAISAPKIPIPFLDGAVTRMPPIVARATPEPAIFLFNWLSATGSAILLSALLSAPVLGLGLRDLLRLYLRTLRDVPGSLVTIAAMLAIGYLTRYAGMDSVLGLAFAATGAFYPFFGTLLGWMGVAITGSDTASNVLFGNLQVVTARQVGVDPVLMAAANSSGGVMGKMIDAQSIVVASTATGWRGHEGAILRYVFWHSLALAALVALLVSAQAR
ncbi:MAG: L-lactate permease [Gemmatimonadetes bacterium]|nr:L-lactate permease [Gemmatimonadota bacterium]